MEATHWWQRPSSGLCVGIGPCVSTLGQKRLANVLGKFEDLEQKGPFAWGRRLPARLAFEIHGPVALQDARERESENVELRRVVDRDFVGPRAAAAGRSHRAWPRVPP